MNQNETSKNRNAILLMAGLLVLTAFLMLVFKYSKDDIALLLDDTQTDLTDFYTQNLKPLFYQTDITNEDVFNFALYKNLPVDKTDNKVVQLGSDAKGESYIELKPAEYIKQTSNYDRFVKYLDLTESEKKMTDSILGNYREEIYASVFIDKQGTYAVNPKLFKVQQLILADLISFVKKRNKKNINKSVFADCEVVNNPEIELMLDEIRKKGTNNFIVITPDSVFQQVCDIDYIKIRDELKRYDKGDRVGNNYEFYKPGTGDVSADSIELLGGRDFVKVVFPNQAVSEKLFARDQKHQQVMKDLEKFALKFSADTINKKISFAFGIGKEKFSMEFNLGELDSLEVLHGNLEKLGEQFENFNAKSSKDWEEFGLRMDSLYNVKYKEEIKKEKQNPKKK